MTTESNHWQTSPTTALLPSNLLPTVWPHLFHLPQMGRRKIKVTSHPTVTIWLYWHKPSESQCIHLRQAFQILQRLGERDAAKMQQDQMQPKKASKLCRVVTVIEINHPQARRPHLAQEGPALKPLTPLDHRSLELEPSLGLHPQPLPTCLWDELLYERIHCRPLKQSKRAQSGTVQSKKLITQNSNTRGSP